jgi:hypothetical protein
MAEKIQAAVKMEAVIPAVAEMEAADPEVINLLHNNWQLPGKSREAVLLIVPKHCQNH